MLRCSLAILALTCVPIPSFAQAPTLRGQVLLVDENGQTTPASAGVEVTIAETGATDRTDAKGLFRIPLPKTFQPGSLITLDAAKPGWAIWQPEEGKTPVPQGLLSVKLLSKGSKRFWTDHFIQTFIESTADKAKLQVKASRPGEPQKPVDFAPLIRDWAVKYGFTPEEAKAQIEKWSADVEASQQDFYKLGLAAFADHNFTKAADLFSEAGQNSEKQLQSIDKQKVELESKRAAKLQETIRNYQKEGDAHDSDYSFAKALTAYQKALTFIDRQSQPELWAQTQVDVGMANWKLGSHAEGPEVHKHLSQAITAYHAVLGVRTREQWPQDWATTQNDLGAALADQGTRISGEEGRQLLAQSVAAYHAALEVRTREQWPQDWATTQNNLGLVLTDQGRRSEGEESHQLLRRAVTAFHAALEVHAREQSPQAWALTQNNLAVALLEQGKRSAGEERRQLLAQAVATFGSTLEVCTRQQFPQDWAMTQNNLGTALDEEGMRSAGEEGRQLLAQAVAAYHLALEVRTRGQLPQDWATTQNNLGAALAHQAMRRGGEEGHRLLAQAAAAFRAALEAFTREQLPQAWAMTQNNLGGVLTIEAKRTAGDEARQLLAEAVAAFRAALEFRTREQLPQDWATTQNNLAQAYALEGEWSKAAENYRNVLQIDPDNGGARQGLEENYHDRTFDFAMAVTLNHDWIRKHPNDTSAQADLAEALFTVARFSEAQAQLSALKDNPNLSTVARAALRALEIAVLIAQHQTEVASTKLHELREFISSQPTDFTITWTWDGDIHFIQTDDRLAQSRPWLESFFKALQAENRDTIVASLNAVAAGLNPSPVAVK